MTDRMRRKIRANGLADRAYQRSGLSEYHSAKMHILKMLRLAIEERLKREDALQSRLRACQQELVQRLVG